MHAFLSPSNYHWINDSDEKLDYRFETAQAARRGVEMHELAQRLIRLGVKLPETSLTINQYVNDAIGFRMTPEQILFYSVNCFGTADAISFRKDKLRVHDLKTGNSKTSERQLYVYAALFCLEYGFKPVEIETELRIYQNNEVYVYDADPVFTAFVMDRIVTFDKRIEAMRQEELA
jgi:hypothetical protein